MILSTATREALRFVLNEMGERLKKQRGRREQLAGELADADTEIRELERRIADVEQDMVQP